MVTSCLLPADIQIMWWPTGGGVSGVFTDYLPPWSSEGWRLYCRHKDSRVRMFIPCVSLVPRPHPLLITNLTGGRDMRLGEEALVSVSADLLECTNV